ncbi:hypothetical protein GGI12_005954, partial [Dipsacomyces acuminosporus]
IKLGVNFARYSDKGGYCKVDKTLVCIGFWDMGAKSGRIHLPRRFGKTYNLSILRLFFSSSLEFEDMARIPDSIISSNVDEMDTATKCTKKREWLFGNSLLKSIHPSFFKAHFMQHPVLHISFASCKDATFAGFFSEICQAIVSAASKWLKELRRAGATLNMDAEEAKDKLNRAINRYEDLYFGPSSQTGNNTVIAKRIFEELSNLLFYQKGEYILLVDEYDIPFITIHQSKWSDAEKESAKSTVKGLLEAMFKANDHLLQGLMVGVFEIPLTELGSGLNDIKTIQLVPGELPRTQGGGAKDIPHSREGIDALSDSFGFNVTEVAELVEKVKDRFRVLDGSESKVMEEIRKMYNGYFVGRFSGKYNPWSVVGYLGKLSDKLVGIPPDSKISTDDRIEAAAGQFWVESGSTTVIEHQLDRHRAEFQVICNRLIREYAKVTSDGR